MDEIRYAEAVRAYFAAGGANQVTDPHVSCPCCTGQFFDWNNPEERRRAEAIFDAGGDLSKLTS